MNITTTLDPKQYQQHLVTMWRDSMRNWALIWRAWRDVCPVTASCALDQAKLRNEWMHEERKLANGAHGVTRPTISVQQSVPLAFEKRINIVSPPAVGEHTDSPTCRRVTEPETPSRSANPQSILPSPVRGCYPRTGADGRTQTQAA